MQSSPRDPRRVAQLEAQLHLVRAVARAQDRWPEVVAAIAEGAPLPLDDLTPAQTSTIMNLQLRRLSPGSRARVRAEVEGLESQLRDAGVDEREPGPVGAAAEDPGEPLASEARGPRWIAYAPLSGQVFVPRDGTDAPVGQAGRPDRHAVRLMNEYTVTWPLWPAGAAERVARLLEDNLTTRLTRWAEVFNDHYDHGSGWDDAAVAVEHRAEADRLLTALRAALPAPWTVTLDYWETNGADR